MKFKTTHILFFVFFGITLFTNAQNKQLQAFTLEDGLPQSQIYAMTQDHNGYLWLGTQGGGLARFDGNEFKVFNESNQLASNYIHALKAINDTLYIGTKRGLSIRVKNKIFNTEIPQVNKICKLNNSIYLLTTEGVFKVSEGFIIEKITLHPQIDNLQVNDMLYYDNYFWIATQTGFWKLNDLNSKAKILKKLETNTFTSLVGFDHKIFAATFNDGTYIFTPNLFHEAILMREPLRINSMSIQNENQLWVATDNNGISVIETQKYAETNIINTTNGLSVTHVREVLADEQSNIWIATSGGGLFKYFQNNFKHFNTETGLNGNRIYAVHHSKGAIWISNSEAGLVKIDSMGIHDIEIPDAFSEIKIKTISSDQNGNIWAGSDGSGLLFRREIIKDSVVLDTLNNIKTIIPVKKEKSYVLNTQNGFPDDWIRKIETLKDTVWVATYSSGIIKFKFNPEADSITVFNRFSKPEGIKDLYIKDMVRDKDNKFWYATQNGHLGYLQNENITHLGAVLGFKTPINTLLFQNNTLFLGTAGKGIWWSNDENYSTFKKLKGIKEGISDNIYQLIFDNQGYLWAGTERGVDKLELDKDNEIKDAFFFGKNDGFLGIETCLNAVDKDQNGHLWFGALYGLTEYQPAEINQESQTPKVFFEDVKVDYKSLDSVNLSTWTNTPKVLKLNPDQRQMSFSFKTVDLDHPNGIQYRYKLNESHWSSWSEVNTRDFLELNFGAHQFSVQSRNYRWKESEPVRFSFYIESPLHKKAWFQWVLIGCAVLSLSILIALYIKRLKRKNAQEQKRLQLENHLLTLEQKALRLQMNPHFIFNVLNGIKAMAPTKPEKMNETVNSFATLLRETLINSRKDTISLDQEIKTIRHYIEVEKLMAEKPFEYQIILNTDYDLEEILIPPMLIQPFVENAIRHGILKGSREGRLNIQFDTTNETLKVTITDNGIGIYSSQKQKPKTDHQSMALKVTRERLESISGKNAIEITEIKNNDGSIGGTIVVFKIPLETDY